MTTQTPAELAQDAINRITEIALSENAPDLSPAHAIQAAQLVECAGLTHHRQCPSLVTGESARGACLCGAGL